MSGDGLHPSHWLTDVKFAASWVWAGWESFMKSSMLKVRRAIKVVHHNLESKYDERRSRREAQVAAQLAHPHIMTVHDIFEHENSVYTVMEMGQGSLVDWVAVHGAVLLRQCVPFWMPWRKLMSKA